MNFQRLALVVQLGAAIVLDAGVASALDVQGKHGQIGLGCAACHQTDAPTTRAPISACKDCHGEYPALAAKTKALDPNPHDSHQGELRCTLCHTGHKPPVVLCDDCHAGKFPQLKPK